MTASVQPPRRPFVGRRVLLGVSGGIAAYKAIALARSLTQAGAEVDVVLTGGGLEFVKPVSFEALTGRRVHSEMYEPGEPLTHIRLAREADVVVIAPATANFIARAAAGMADDLLTAILLATRAPVVVAPAMNDRMYQHPQTRANIDSLARIGYSVVGPAAGPLAWGEGEGPGRMLEPDAIMEHAGRTLTGPTIFTARAVIVTAGPTREPLDPVRYLGNRSSGRMGYALAAAAWRRGAGVTLISGPTSLPTPTGVELVRVETAEEMHAEVSARIGTADALLMAAAVADFRPATSAGEKIKKGAEAGPDIRLARTPDVLASTIEERSPGCRVVGFALETENLLENARRKLEDKRMDLLVLNDAREEGAGFEVDTNRVTILSPSAAPEELPLLPKYEVAERILDRLEALLTPHPA